MKTPGDPRNTYLTSLQWTDDSRALLIQQLNRLQNTNDLLVGRRAHRRRAARARRARQARGSRRSTISSRSTAGRAVTWTSEKDGWRHLYRVALDGSGDQLLTKFEADVIDVVSVDVAGGWAYLIASPGSATERFLYRARLDGRGSVERVTPAGRARHAHLSDLAGRTLGAPHVLERRRAAARRSRQPARSSRRADARGQRRAGREGRRRCSRRATEFFTVDIGGGVVLDGSMIKPAGVRSVEALSGDRLRLRRAGVADRGRSLGRQPRALQPRARQRGLHRRQLRQPRHAGAEGHGVAEGGLRHGRRSVVEGTGGGGARVRGVASVRRSRSRRHLGLERRRLEHAERDVPLSRRLQGRRVGRAGSRSAALRHDLPGTLHGPAAGQRRGLSRRLADQLRRGAEGQAAHRPRLGRRQRALPGNRAAGEPARRARQAVRPDGLPEPHARDLGRAPAPACTCTR